MTVVSPKESGNSKADKWLRNVSDAWLGQDFKWDMAGHEDCEGFGGCRTVHWARSGLGLWRKSGVGGDIR